MTNNSGQWISHFFLVLIALRWRVPSRRQCHSWIGRSHCQVIGSLIDCPRNKSRQHTSLFRTKAFIILPLSTDSVIFFIPPPCKVIKDTCARSGDVLVFLLESHIRIVTLILGITLLRKLVYNEEEKRSYLSDDHLSRIKQANEQATENLRRHFHV